MLGPHHDRLFKAIVSHLENVVGLCRASLPPALTDALDESSLTRVPGTFVDQELAELYTDRLFSLKLAGRETLLYVLAEHKSSVDPLTLLQLLTYMTRIWRAWLTQEENQGAEKLPAILPLLVHHGPDGWTAPTEFLDLIDLPPDLLQVARDFLPSFRVALDDLCPQTDEALRQRPMGPLGVLGLLLLRHAATSARRSCASSARPSSCSTRSRIKPTELGWCAIYFG